jgi:hypothetical protein
VAHAKHENQQPAVVNLVDDSIVSSSNSPLTRTTDELRCSGRTWILGQQLKDRLNPTSNIRIKFAKLAGG